MKAKHSTPMKIPNSDVTQLGYDEDETISKTEVYSIKLDNKSDPKSMPENEKVNSQQEENNKLVTPSDKQTTSANTEVIEVNCHNLNENTYEDHELD